MKLFRKIRKKMADDNRPLKYLRYAIGEIVLVVIGILIALSINNWNETRKNLISKDLLLNALKVEFNLNLQQLDSVLYYDNRIIKSTNRILHLKENEYSTTPTDTIRKIVQNTSWLWTFDPLNGALRSGISSGNIHLIKNDTLVNLLFSWQDIVADAKENEDRSINIRIESQNVLNRFIRSIDYRSVVHYELGVSNFPSDYIALLNDPLFEDYISERNTHTLDAVYELLIVKNQNIKILELIDQELKND